MRIITRLGAAALSTGILITALAGVAVARTPPGSLDVHGSSTVAPISLAVSEDFAATNPNWGYFVGDEGTGDGFTQFFCVDNGDVADASRAIHEDEAALCGENGVDYVELKIGYDGLAVITSPQNPVECLNKYDLWALFGNESNGITTWQDAEAFAARDGLHDRLPRWRHRDHGAGHRVRARTTRSSSSPLARRPRSAASSPARATRCRRPTSARPTTSSSSRASRSSRPRSASSASPTRTTPATPSRSSQVDEGDGCVAASPETRGGRDVRPEPAALHLPRAEPPREQPGDRPLGRLLPVRRGHRNVSEVGYVQLPAEELQATRDAWSAATGG